MKKSDKPPVSEPSTTATPPIENNQPEQKNESQPQEKNETDKSAVETIATPPIGDVTPTTPAASNVETISAPPISNEPAPIHQAQPILPNQPETPPPVKTFSGLSDWMKADWNKSNVDLAKENNVSRQAVAQMRKKVEAAKASGMVPNFSDINRPAPEAVPADIVDYDAMAATVFDMSTGLLTSAFGPEWQPKPPQGPGMPGERDAVCAALKHYLKSKNTPDIPPGLMLTAVVIAYAGPRLREPNTMSKLQMAWTWFKVKVSKLRKKKV